MDGVTGFGEGVASDDVDGTISVASFKVGGS